ncbi:MAG: DUF4443 domain-containing protein [Nitrososphaerota archaeon]
MRVLEVIRRASGQGHPGPLPTFSLVHIVRAIYLIAENPGIGRKRLAATLGLGEGVARTLLSRLKSQGLVETKRSGCFLTDSAQTLYKELMTRMSRPHRLNIKDTWPYSYSVWITVKGAAGLVKMGLEQRDAAIRAGASAAITLVYQDGRLLMPNLSDVSGEYPDFAGKIIEEIRPAEGDVIIIAGANDLQDAENGAIAAALATLGHEEV